mmetsp:Transcript_7560/g.24843  ORF Transcript_7560/g.24843 Transcript_7560/m.24843 type:complete len:301 (-) Transcript_7560:31-933(-)
MPAFSPVPHTSTLTHTYSVRGPRCSDDLRIGLPPPHVLLRVYRHGAPSVRPRRAPAHGVPGRGAAALRAAALVGEGGAGRAAPRIWRPAAPAVDLRGAARAGRDQADADSAGGDDAVVPRRERSAPLGDRVGQDAGLPAAASATAPRVQARPASCGGAFARARLADGGGSRVDVAAPRHAARLPADGDRVDGSRAGRGDAQGRLPRHHRHASPAAVTGPAHGGDRPHLLPPRHTGGRAGAGQLRVAAARGGAGRGRCACPLPPDRGRGAAQGDPRRPRGVARPCQGREGREQTRRQRRRG